METSFMNPQQALENLPDFEKLSYQALATDYLKVIYISRAITLLILAIGIGITVFFWAEIRPFWWAFIIAFGVVTFLALAFVNIAFKAKSFAMRNHDIVYKSGFITLETTLIPFNRVQHIEIHEGVLMRMYDLASLQIFTAGGAMSDLKITGLHKTDAERLKAFITGKITTEPVSDVEVSKTESEVQTNLDEPNNETI
jgi:hypothetical protein